MSAQNPKMYAANNNKMEPVHGRLNTSKGVWNLSLKSLFQYGETSQPQVDISLPLSLVYDAQPSMSVKPEHQGDLSFDGEIENKRQKNDQGLDLSDHKRHNRSQRNRKNQRKDPYTIKGRWKATENRYIK
jgi:hypothetical protein